MGLYNRGTAKKPNWWISYAVTEEQRIRHGLRERTAREGSGGDQRQARALLAQRRREVRDGTWAPATECGGQTLEGYARKWCAARKAAGVATAANEEQRLVDYVLPTLGKRLLGEVRRVDVRELFAQIQAKPSKHTGEPHAPRTIHRIYEALRTLYNTALLDEIVDKSPCTLRIKRGELPEKRDKDPEWRAGAIFTRDELEQLLSDERIPLGRRVYYAISFLGGTRLGETSGRRWRDYDAGTRPLGRLSCLTQYDGDPLKGGRPGREVPVHPVLAALLARWRLEWPLVYGRQPTPDDFIVSKRGLGRAANGPKVGFRPGPISEQTAWANLQRDLVTLGLRRRRLHDTRRTLISLAIGDGADKYQLRWITHGPPKSDAFDSYMSPDWETLCKQISCLRISLRGQGEVVPIERKRRKAGT